MTKGPIFQDIWDNLPSDRKARIEARTRKLEAEYLTLQELRKKVGLTQARVWQELGMSQSNVSAWRRIKHAAFYLASIC